MFAVNVVVPPIVLPIFMVCEPTPTSLLSVMSPVPELRAMLLAFPATDSGPKFPPVVILPDPLAANVIDDVLTVSPIRPVLS